MKYSGKYIILALFIITACASLLWITSIQSARSGIGGGAVDAPGGVFPWEPVVDEETGAVTFREVERGLPSASSGGWFYNQLVKFLEFLISMVIYLLGFVTGIAVVLLDAATSISKFSTNPVVEVGWRFTRDALNFMFILAILIVAFAEIAGLSDWNIKKLLPRLLIAALLVNFSLAIGGAFVDFSRVLMDTISGDNATELSRQLMKASVIERFYKFDPDNYFSLTKQTDADNQEQLDVGADSATSRLVAHLIAAIMIFLITATLIVAALFMLVRAIALWVLLILSPVGFVFTILPQTKQWADKWWETFIKYVLYGPVFVFFLALASQIGQALEQGAPGEGLRGMLYLDNTGPSNAGGMMNFLLEQPLGSTIFQAMLVTIFIFAGILSAQAMGIYGGGKAAGMVTGLAGLGLKGVREGTLAGYGGRRIKAGWQAASAERAREAELKQRTSIPGRIGAFARAPFSSETRERATQRSVAERAKQMDESGVEGRSAVAAMNDEGKTMVERRASALHAAKLDALDKPEEYQTALKLLEGTKEHANVQRNYRRSHPMLERTGSTKIGEVTAKLNAMPEGQRVSVVKEIQDDVRKAKSDQARDWSGETIRVMVENKIHPGSSNVRTIMREGNSEARSALKENKSALEDHEKTMLASEGGSGSQQSYSGGGGI